MTFYGIEIIICFELKLKQSIKLQGAEMSAEYNSCKSVRELHSEYYVLDYNVIVSGMLLI